MKGNCCTLISNQKVQGALQISTSFEEKVLRYSIWDSKGHYNLAVSFKDEF